MLKNYNDKIQIKTSFLSLATTGQGMAVCSHQTMYYGSKLLQSLITIEKEHTKETFKCKILLRTY